MIWRLVLICLCLALPARAEEVVAGLSQARVSITTDFSGSEILVFGAVKREAPIPDDAPLHVIITVTGPDHPVTVRKKDRKFGIWVNTQAAAITAAPSFYAVATTGPLKDILTETEDVRHKISIERSIRAVGVPTSVDEPEAFIAALIRIRSQSKLYQIREDSVRLDENTLFRTGIALPANLTEGDYIARIFLTRGGQVIDRYDTVIGVRKVGLERFLFNLAHDLPLVYGLMSLAIAILSGWGASAIFRYIRN